MKNINIVNITSFLILLGAVLASSCAYDESDKIAGLGPNIVKFEATEGATNSVFNTPDGDVDLVQIRRDAKNSAVLATSTTFEFEIDDQIVTDYNVAATEYNLHLDSDGDGIDDLDPKPIYVNLDHTSYTIGTSLTFDAGETIKPIKIKVTALDLSTPYAVGAKLKNPPADWVNSGNNSSVLISIVIQNQYDGIYVVSGTRWNFSTAADVACGTNPPPSGFISSSTFIFENQFTTVGAATNAVSAGNLDNTGGAGFGNILVTTNPDNTISIAPDADLIGPVGGPAGLANWKQNVCYSSSYDPIKKKYTIYEQWTNLTGTHRIVQKFVTKK
jgi:Domain of unknown function (DUF1735)